MGTFDNQSTYAKFNGGCDCKGECSCGKSENCGCCPIGTVAVTDDCGKHVGCLSPNDASEYEIRKHVPATGYVKLFHPTTGAYLGDVTPADALAFMASIDDTITPPEMPGAFNPSLSSYEIAMSAPADDATDTEPLAFAVDRVSCTQGIIIQFSGTVPAGVSFLGGAMSLLIPEGQSVIMDGIEIDDQVNAGTINLVIAFSGCAGTITKELTITVS